MRSDAAEPCGACLGVGGVASAETAHESVHAHIDTVRRLLELPLETDGVEEHALDALRFAAEHLVIQALAMVDGVSPPSSAGAASGDVLRGDSMIRASGELAALSAVLANAREGSNACGNVTVGAVMIARVIAERLGGVEAQLARLGRSATA